MKTNLQKLNDMQLIGLHEALILALCYDYECDYLYSFFRSIESQINELEEEINKRGLNEKTN